MKEELTKLINNTIKFFVGEKYIQNEAQNWVNEISNQIILNISAKKLPNYKFICSTTIFQKGNSTLNYSRACFWNPTDDKNLTIKYENDYLHCFVALAWIKLPKDNKGEPPSNLNNNKNNISQKKGNLYSPNFKEKKINNEASNNNSNNKPNENFERKLKRSNTQSVLNKMNNMNINLKFMNELGMNMNFPQMGINNMFTNRINMGQFNFNNLNMNMNPMLMNNNNFAMGMNRMNYRPMNMNMNPLLMNNVKNRNNKFNLPQMMIAQNNNFKLVNNLNNINNINNSNNNNINISNQNINNDGNINVLFKTNDNQQTFISASPFTKVKDIFINYASRSGVNKNLLGNKIFFYYKANVLDINDERFICEVFENNSIILVTKIN